MVFSSQLFIFYFLPLVLLVYYISPSRVRHLGLTIFSYVFYGWANPWFVLLMLGTTVVDYVVGLWIAGALGRREIPLLTEAGPRTRSQKLALATSVVCAFLTSAMNACGRCTLYGGGVSYSVRGVLA